MKGGKKTKSKRKKKKSKTRRKKGGADLTKEQCIDTFVKNNICGDNKRRNIENFQSKIILTNTQLMVEKHLKQ